MLSTINQLCKQTSVTYWCYKHTAYCTGYCTTGTQPFLTLGADSVLRNNTIWSGLFSREGVLK